MMTYNDLLIEILNLTPEQRKQQVLFTDNRTFPAEVSRSVTQLYFNFDEVYLLDD